MAGRGEQSHKQNCREADQKRTAKCSLTFTHKVALLGFQVRDEPKAFGAEAQGLCSLAAGHISRISMSRTKASERLLHRCKRQTQSH